MNKKIVNSSFLVLLGLALLAPTLFSACGGGGGGAGGGSTPAASQPRLSGTVASGGPISGVTVTVLDTLGNTWTATTGINGVYSIDTATFTAPFLVLATTNTGTKLYSVSADANAASTVNVTPLTDLIIRSWYDAQTVSIDDAFAAPGANPPPAPSALAVINSVVKNTVQLWLNDAGVSTSGFNLISTPFTATHSGFDDVLDQTTCNPVTGDLLISNGSITQTSKLTAAAGSMNIVTTTTNTLGQESTSSIGTIVPYTAPQQAALDGLTTAFNNFAAAVNLKSSGTLTTSDLLPFLETGGLWSGYTSTQWAGQVAYSFSGNTVSFSGIAIKSLVTHTADVIFQLSQSSGGQTRTQPNELYFSDMSGNWLLSGDQSIANVEVRAAEVRNQGSATGTNLVLEVHVDAPRSSPTVTSLDSVAITGGPWLTPTSLAYNGQSVAPWDSTLTSDAFEISVQNPAISGGDVFLVDVALSSDPSTTVTYTRVLNAITNEPISITNLAGSNLTLNAHPGTPLTVNWTLPKTFAISMIRLGTVAYTGAPGDPGTFKCDDGGEQVVLGITSTSGVVTIPATCHGNATLQAEIYLQVFGINGELTQVYYTYN
jgi:hypothetical protein